MAQVAIRNVAKAFGAVKVLHGVSVDIADGQFVVLVGPSGCGKSTLLRMVAGLERRHRRHDRHRRPQWSTICRPPSATSRWCSRTTRSIRTRRCAEHGFRAEAAQDRPGRDRRAGASAPPKSSTSTPISTAIRASSPAASASASPWAAPSCANPQVFLFDEPLSNLDAKLRVQMRTEIKELHQRLKTTTIYVTHDQIEAMTMADKIVVMQRRPHRAGGRAAGTVRPAGQHVRRRLHRLAGHELAQGRGARRGRRRWRAAFPGARRGRGPARSFSASGPKTSCGRPTEQLGVEALVKVVEPTGSETQLLPTWAGARSSRCSVIGWSSSQATRCTCSPTRTGRISSTQRQASASTKDAGMLERTDSRLKPTCSMRCPPRGIGRQAWSFCLESRVDSCRPKSPERGRRPS